MRHIFKVNDSQLGIAVHREQFIFKLIPDTGCFFADKRNKKRLFLFSAFENSLEKSKHFVFLLKRKSIVFQKLRIMGNLPVHIQKFTSITADFVYSKTAFILSSCNP